jgi:hypothetical protein
MVKLTKAKMNHNMYNAILRPNLSLTKCIVVMAMICPTDWIPLQAETVMYEWFLVLASLQA